MSDRGQLKGAGRRFIWQSEKRNRTQEPPRRGLRRRMEEGSGMNMDFVYMGAFYLAQFLVFGVLTIVMVKKRKI